MPYISNDNPMSRMVLQPLEIQAGEERFVNVLESVLSQVRSTLLAEHVRTMQQMQAKPVDAELGCASTRTQQPLPQKEASAASMSMTYLPGMAHSVPGYVRRQGTVTDGRNFFENKDRPPTQTNMVSNLGLRHDHALRERAHIYLSNLPGRMDPKSSRDLAFKKFRRLMHISRVNPLTALDSVMTLLVVLNAAVIGISSDTPDWIGWVVIDSAFAVLFLCELLLKLRLLGPRIYFCGYDRSWHGFEVILVVLSIAEIPLSYLNTGSEFIHGNTSLFRIFRIVRLTKLLRVCRLQSFKDLVMMLNGAAGGWRTLFWSIILIALPLYVVALVLRESLSQESTRESESFSTLSKSFFTLFRCVVAQDCADERGRPIFVHLAEKHGWGYACIYGITFVFMTFGLFNVIVAIYVENTVAAAKLNEMKRKELRLRDQELFREKSLELAILAYSLKTGKDVRKLELNGMDLGDIYDMEFTHDEFANICDNESFSELLDELDIAKEDHSVLFDTLDIDRGGTLDVNELIAGIAKLRGDARKSDIVTMILGLRQMQRHLKHFTSDVTECLIHHTEVLTNIEESVVNGAGVPTTLFSPFSPRGVISTPRAAI